MWDLGQLKKELGETYKMPRPSDNQYPVLRHYIVYVNIERIVCFQRHLLPGSFKIRLTFSSLAAPDRAAISYESAESFSSSQILKNQGSFRLAIPVNRVAGPDQLSNWRCELEVLNKFPSAPIYSVIARSWLSADLLLAAEAIDLFPPIAEGVGPDETAVKLEIRSVTSSGLAINLFRTVGRAVAFACSLVKAVKFREEKKLKQLEKEIRFMETQNARERQTAQIEVMMRTIQVLNKYMSEGAKPDDWLRALASRGLISTGNDVLKERELENRIGDLAKQIETMRNDFIKVLVEKQNQPSPAPPVIQLVQTPQPPAAVAPTVPVERITQPKRGLPAPSPTEKPKGFLIRNPGRTALDEDLQDEAPAKSSGKSRPDNGDLPPQFEIPATSLAPSKESRSATPSVGSVRLEPVEAEPAEEPDADEPPPVEVAAPVTLVAAPLAARVVAKPKLMTPPTATPAAEEPQDVFTSFWGAVTSAKGGTPPRISGAQTPKKSVNASPLVQAVMQPPPVVQTKQPIVAAPYAPSPTKPAAQAVKVPTGPPVKVAAGAAPTSPTKAVAKKAVVVSPPKKTLDPKTQMALAMKAKQAMLKAKIQQALQIKALEAKRMAEVEEKAKEIAELAKKFAPADRTKFIGLPPPPPFKAKAKQPPPQPENALPSVMDTGPPVEVPSGEVLEDEDGAEEVTEEVT